MKKQLVMLIVIVLLFSCDRRNDKVKNSEYIQQNNKLVYIEYYSNGRVKYEMYCNGDSLADGEQFGYDSIGKLCKWKWQRADSVYTSIAVIYKNGKYFDYVGSVFLHSYKLNEHEVAIEMAKIPQMKPILKYSEVDDGVILRRATFLPGETDSTIWISIDNINMNKKVIKKLIYYFRDDKNNILDSNFTEIIM